MRGMAVWSIEQQYIKCRRFRSDVMAEGEQQVSEHRRHTALLHSSMREHAFTELIHNVKD